ncbi:MAG: hypothetical protein J6U00_11575 [Ruminococcus sp.]|uniref:hypothetical protein n=1 Tax=Ruminococcus sp. TaxID=41978 RepID=UPI001B273AB9|nr:hypothetical protein [Ruminococcus sp.]MBO7474611.1 hypothetical protein [Ruminococcus sp.]
MPNVEEKVYKLYNMRMGAQTSKLIHIFNITMHEKFTDIIRNIEIYYKCTICEKLYPKNTLFGV